MIVSLELPLNVAANILGCILSMLLNVFNSLGPIRIPTPPTVAFTRAKSDAVYVCGLSVGHGYVSMSVFILIYRSHSNR